MNFYAEITKQHYPGKDLWAPVNPKIWHWKLLTDLEKEDIIYHIYTKKHPSRIIGISIVAEKYIIKDMQKNSQYYPKYKKTYHVTLKKFKEFAQPIIINDKLREKIVDIGSIKHSPFQDNGHLKQIYFAKFDKKYVDLFDKQRSDTDAKLYVDEGIDNISLIDLLNQKKQIILYGPPGTGKTYHTKKIAVEIYGGLNANP